jgi:hypothetical protein
LVACQLTMIAQAAPCSDVAPDVSQQNRTFSMGLRLNRKVSTINSGLQVRRK